jgi:hypothetical protein
MMVNLIEVMVKLTRYIFLGSLLSLTACGQYMNGGGIVDNGTKDEPSPTQTEKVEVAEPTPESTLPPGSNNERLPDTTVEIAGTIQFELPSDYLKQSSTRYQNIFNNLFFEFTEITASEACSSRPSSETELQLQRYLCSESQIDVVINETQAVRIDHNLSAENIDKIIDSIKLKNN